MLNNLVSTKTPEWIEPTLASNLNPSTQRIMISETRLVLGTIQNAEGILHPHQSILVSGERYLKHTNASHGNASHRQLNADNPSHNFRDMHQRFDSNDATLFILMAAGILFVVRSNRNSMPDTVLECFREWLDHAMNSD